MFPLAWATLGFLSGVLLEAVALRLAGEPARCCPRCGREETGPRWSALLRIAGSGGPRCRGCGAWSLLWLAGLGPAQALVFWLSAERWSVGPGLIVASLYGAALLLVAALDLRHRLVYPSLVYPATLAAIVATPPIFGQPLWSGLAGAAAGALLFFGLYALAARLYRGRGALGFGDVMIAGLVGAISGLPAVAAALTTGALLGGVGAVLVGLLYRSRRAHFAYGPALCLGSLLVLLGGPHL